MMLGTIRTAGAAVKLPGSARRPHGPSRAGVPVAVFGCGFRSRRVGFPGDDGLMTY